MLNPPPSALPLGAIRDAARVCRHVQRDLGRIRAMTKDDRSPVTIADFAAQAVVARALHGAGPCVLVAEESAEFLRDPQHASHLRATVSALSESGAWPDARPDSVLDAIQSGAGDPLGPDDDRPWWTLDPVDGTKGFVRGQQYAVALACIRRGRVVLGMMACPNLSIDHDAGTEAVDPHGTLYVASPELGVMEWSLARPDGRRLPARAPGEGTAPVLAESVESGHSDQSLSERIMSLAVRARGGEFRVVRLDSQAKYAVVARAQADVYLRLPTRRGYVERIWDHAAGSIIAEQSGCKVTDIRGRSLNFGLGRGLEANLGVVAAPPALHGRLIEAIRGLGIGGDGPTP